MWEGSTLPAQVAEFFEDLRIIAGCERQKRKREFNREAALKGLGK